MITLGADVEALQALATSMDDAAARLDMIARTLGRQLGGSPWRGGDADGFRGAWEGRLLGSIHRVGAALHDAARLLRTNADQQHQASTVVGATGGSRFDPCVVPAGPVTGAASVASRWAHMTVGAETTVRLSPVALMQRLESVAAKGSFEILQIGTVPPRYIVVLPGVENFNPFGTGTDRDLPNATLARLGIHDFYAERVKIELERAGVPAGSEVMLFGHSYGSIAAMNIASDTSFNKPGTQSLGGPYHVQVTHVVAAGAGIRDWIDRPPPGTDILMVINRADSVATAMEAVDPGPLRAAGLVPGILDTAGGLAARVGGRVATGVDVVADGRVLFEFTDAADWSGHHWDNYERGLMNAGGQADAWLDGAMGRYLPGDPLVTPITVAVPDELPSPSSGGGGW